MSTTITVAGTCANKQHLTLSHGPSPTVNEWPKALSGHSVWHGTQLNDPSSYIYTLSAQEIEEIETALGNFKQLGLSGRDINKNSFRLPLLETALEAKTLDLHDGKGFFAIRGIENGKYSIEDNVLIFLGISSHVGDRRAKQDDNGNIIVHIRHDKESYPASGQGPTRYSNKASLFHTDAFCDIVALQVRSTAASGGSFKLASTSHIYNELMAKNADLVSRLAAPTWTFANRGKLFPAQVRPLLMLEDGRAILDFYRTNLNRGAQEAVDPSTEGVARRMQEALDAIEATAQDSNLVLETQPGDLVFFNNHAVIHARDAFEDDDVHARYVLRMWLKNSKLAWSLPRHLEEGNQAIFKDNTLPETWAIVEMPPPREPWNFIGAMS